MSISFTRSHTFPLKLDSNYYSIILLLLICESLTEFRVAQQKLLCDFEAVQVHNSKEEACVLVLKNPQEAIGTSV